MFRIVSYRIKRAITIKTLQRNSLKNDNLLLKELIYAVDTHRKAMKFSELIVSKFQVMFSLSIAVGVVCESLNFCRILQLASLKSDINELLLRFLFIYVHVVYAFIGNYLGQEIMDHNNNIFVTIYNIQWYLAPLQVQKMILFVLQRGTKTFNLTIAGIFVGSLQGAATLLSTIVSYFTVLYSTQQ